MGRLDIRRFYEEFERREIMINPCIKCIERDRCEGMQQPCRPGKAYQRLKAGCKRVAEHMKQVNKRAKQEV